MSAPSSSSSSRVSIPNGLRKTIQNLKEIAKNHSDEEIYAMLRDCSMDPNETAQKLLLQDPFREVKRKRDKKKENNRELADTRWRPASQGRGGRGGGRGTLSSHFISHDAGGETKIIKENGVHQVINKSNISSSSAPSQNTEIKTTLPVSSSLAGLPNSAKIENPVKENSTVTTQKTVTPPIDDAKGSGISSGNVSTMKREVRTQQTAVETIDNKVISRDVSRPEVSSSVGKDSSAVNHSYMHGKMQGKPQGLDGDQFLDVSQATPSLSRTNSSGSRPSSNYSNRSQLLNGSQKAVASAKEWKPKSSNVKTAPVLSKVGTSDVKPTTQDAATATARSLPASSSIEESTSTLQKKLGELQFSDAKHVIIPNHLQVPESERSGLNFGTFDANFGLASSLVNDTESDKGSSERSELSQEIEENAENFTSSNQNASPTAQEAEYADHSLSPANVPENLTSTADHTQSPVEMQENLTSHEHDVSSSIHTASEYEKPEAAPAGDGSQYSVIHTAPAYPNLGFVPQILGNPFVTFEGVEPQVRDATRMPNFLVQQPFDPAANYYTSVYRPTAADGDGRFSPFVTPGSTKYTGNVAVFPTQTGQTPQESGNSLVLPSTGQLPQVTQASGVMQSTVALSQQSPPVFRQTPGVHISHYPSTFHPYSQYFSPMYLPSPSMHPFLSNTAFPQQPSTGNIYPTPGAVGTATVKYPIAQYKPTANNPSHIGMPPSYGTYNPSAGTSGSSTGSEDLTSSQYKENNVYIAGRQGEGSIWIPTSGRDMSSMQPTAFYNLPTQGQHMSFPGIYHHPGQTIAAATVHPMLQQSQAMAGPVEMVGPTTGGVYQQPQRTQFNWVHNP